MKIGIIGTGFGARVVAPAFASVAGVEVAEIVSPHDAEAVRRLCQRSDIGLISIQSPPFLHREHVSLASAAGKALLCDKPLGATAAQAESCLEAARRAGVRHFLNVEFRCAPTREKLRELMKSGAVGRIEHVHWFHHSAGARVPMRRHGWLFDAALGGGWVGAWAPHAVDFLHWTLGDILEAGGTRRLVVKERPDRNGAMQRCTAEDGLAAILTVRGGATAVFDSSFVASAPLPQRLVVIGSEGSLIEEGGHRLLLARGKASEVVAESETLPDSHVIPMARFSSRIVEALRGGAAHGLPTLEDGVAIARVLDRLRALPLFSA
jgi:predicted dehydrogenase